MVSALCGRQVYYRLVSQLMGDEAAADEDEARFGTGESDADLGRNRRGTDRFNYHYLQQVAPKRSDHFPTTEEFRRVRFYDLSQTGFSYITNKLPDYNELIARLGEGAKVVHVLAEVMHITELRTPQETTYKIGCRILRRCRREEMRSGTRA